jgi:hypothetical protein
MDHSFQPIGAVGIVLANAVGVIVPFMGVALHSRTGSWVPHLEFERR